jgi:hypothetical protein
MPRGMSDFGRSTAAAAAATVGANYCTFLLSMFGGIRHP